MELTSFQLGRRITVLLGRQFSATGRNVRHFTNVQFLKPGDVAGLLFKRLVVHVIRRRLRRLILRQDGLSNLSIFLVMRKVLILEVTRNTRRVDLVVPKLFSTVVM